MPRGTAIVPATAASPAGFPNVVDSIGSNRTPTTWNLDLGAYYPIKFGENRQLRFQLDWFNVFNNQRAIRLDETFEITSGVTGVPNVPNPFYGSGTYLPVPVGDPPRGEVLLLVYSAAGAVSTAPASFAGRSAKVLRSSLFFLVSCPRHFPDNLPTGRVPVRPPPEVPECLRTVPT